MTELSTAPRFCDFPCADGRPCRNQVKAGFSRCRVHASRFVNFLRWLKRHIWLTSIAAVIVSMLAWLFPRYLMPHPDIAVELQEATYILKFMHRFDTIVTASLTNIGSPGAVKDYTLEYVNGDGAHFGPFRPIIVEQPRDFDRLTRFRPGPPPKELPPIPKMVLDPSDILYTKTLKPIEQGGYVWGRLLFEVCLPEEQSLEFDKSKFVLCLHDVRGKKSCDEYLLNPAGLRGEFPYPGLKHLTTSNAQD